MYSCVRGLVKGKGVNARFQELQVGDVTVRHLYSSNSVVVLILTHTAVDHELSLDLNDALDKVLALHPNTTVDAWLTQLGDGMLPAKNTIPEIKSSTIKYNDVFHAGYDVERIHPLAGDGNEYQDVNLTDVRLSRIDTDYSLLYKSCLVSVNGLLHVTDFTTRGLLVKDAGRTCYKSNRNHLGLISFREIGDLTILPISEEMLKPRHAGRPLKDGLLIDLGDVDLSSKIAMISIGGVLFHSNDRYMVVGNNTILVEWWKLNFWQMYYDTRNVIDTKTFDETLDRGPFQGDAMDLARAASDESIAAYLSLSQSFVILVETDSFYVDQHMLENTGLRGRYYSNEAPKFPLQLGNGFLPPYVAAKETNGYVLAIDDNLLSRYVHETRDNADVGYVHSGRISQFQQFYSPGWLLEMGKDYLE